MVDTQLLNCPQSEYFSPVEADAASIADGYSQEQESLLRRSCCVLIEAAGQKLKVYAYT